MKVFMVMFDWSTQDDSQVDVELFDSYKKAFDRFNEIIANEKNAEMSWAADAFDENDNIQSGYEFEEHLSEGYDCWWNITNKDDRYVHDFLDLKELEVM